MAACVLGIGHADARRQKKRQRTEAQIDLYVAHMGWGCCVRVINLMSEVRGKTQESEAWQCCMDPDSTHSPRLQAGTHRALPSGNEARKGPRSRQQTEICTVALLRAQPQGVDDLGYARVRGGWDRSVLPRRRGTTENDEGSLFAGRI